MKHNYVAVPEIKKADCFGCTCIRNRTTLDDLCNTLKRLVPTMVEKSVSCSYFPSGPEKCTGVIWIKDTPKHRVEYVARKLTS